MRYAAANERRRKGRGWDEAGNAGGKCRSTDWIFKHMTLAKLLVVHLKGIPETLAALGLKQFISEIWMHTCFLCSESAEMCPLAPSSS
ncbi:hypothetical protein MG293_015789 [Ovis ammon polii]|uniref:Uncharacterized protein n=1 Tax=Ovis ammon polii TaxID=230172 RepID=A0AAD4TYV4_OVIAM|nr:hypothetical protein MG293_015789 [Ovis ammon polii]